MSTENTLIKKVITEELKIRHWVVIKGNFKVLGLSYIGKAH